MIRDTLTAIISLPTVVAHALVPKSINTCTSAMNAWATEIFENPTLVFPILHPKLLMLEIRFSSLLKILNQKQCL